jgi:beta-glucosidase
LASPINKQIKKSIMAKLILILAATVIFSGCGKKSPLTTGTDSEPGGEKNIESLLKQMTLEEKIGQLTLLTSDWDVTGPTLNENYKALIKEGKVGAIFNAYTVDYVRELQRLSVEETRLKIPLLFGYDVIHGHRTIFPIPLGQSCSWNLELIEDAERISAIEATAEGINWTFAPMVDLARDPRWGRVSEGSGEDTWLGCRIAEARIKGFQGNGLNSGKSLLACAKHFAAYGAALAGRDYNTVDLSMISLHEWYLPPYKACIDAGAGSVMTSFNEINGVPSTSNPWLLTDLLRKDWGFNGFVVTDYTSINELIPHGVAENLTDAAALAINAGVDMDMQGSAFLSSLKDLVAQNKVSVSQIDMAVRRILEAKHRLGLFRDPYLYCDKNRQESEIMTSESLKTARKLVSESCVLLKNEKQTLPIPPGLKTIAVIGPLGDSKMDMLGNWSAAGDWEKCVTLLEGIRNRAGDKTEVVYCKGCNANDQDESGFSEAVKLAEKSDFVILALGENGWMGGEASSRTQLNLPGMQNELAEAVMKTGKPAVVVLFNSRPLTISKLNNIAPAILETWFGGTQAGNGIADVLFGDYNPSGKLTMTFPLNEGQIPVFYNAKNTGRPYNPGKPDEKYVSRYLDSPNSPLFPFGFGLSYTTFRYDDLNVICEDEKIEIEVKVTNSGERDGEEVVQLYVQDKAGTITRPVKELKGFRKVMIKKGETKILNFTVTKDDLAFYHPDIKRYFEPGEFIIYVGTNSAETVSRSIVLE